MQSFYQNNHPWYFQNTLSTMIVFYTALLLIKKLSSQPKIYSYRPMIIEFTGLIVFPKILTQLA